jgi:hypothetical protein
MAREIEDIDLQDRRWFVAYIMDPARRVIPFENHRENGPQPGGKDYEKEYEELKVAWDGLIPIMLHHLRVIQSVFNNFNTLHGEELDIEMKKAHKNADDAKILYQQVEKMARPVRDPDDFGPLYYTALRTLKAKLDHMTLSYAIDDDLIYFGMHLDDYYNIMTNLYNEILRIDNALTVRYTRHHMSTMMRKNNQNTRLQRLMQTLGNKVDPQSFYHANALKKTKTSNAAKASNHGGKRRTKCATRKRVSVRHRR